jgi:ApaG protein
MLPMPELVTRDVRVRVQNEFVPERSSPTASEFVFTYKVQIANLGAETIQVMGRRWVITDAFGEYEEVAGEGVVGEQPVIRPGEEFRYSSFCPIKTSFGTMKGEFEVITDAGESFMVEIPEFVLAHPHSVH